MKAAPARFARQPRRGRGLPQQTPAAVDDSLLGVVVRRKKPMQVANVQTSAVISTSRLRGRKGWFHC